jgi:hypothetical protein
MEEAQQKRIELAQEDAARMTRLTEEVTGRLREMAMIVGRTTGVTIESGVVPKFVPVTRTPASDVPSDPAHPPVDLEIEIYDLPDGTHCCYDYLNQVCACPC